MTTRTRKLAHPAATKSLAVIATALALTSCGTISVASSEPSVPKSAVTAVPKSTPTESPNPEPSKTKEPLPYETVSAEDPSTNPFYITYEEGSISEGWDVEESAQLWNDLAECELFTFDEPPASPGHASSHWTVTISETNEEFAWDDPQGYWGLTEGWTLEGPTTIKLNIYFGAELAPTVHELGHVLGLEHSDDQNSVMSIQASLDTPSSEDIEGVLKLNSERC